MEQKKLVIGLSGTICSGKGVVAEILKHRGLHVARLSDVIRDELKILGLEPIRKNLQDVGNNLRKELGPQILVQRLLEKHKSNIPLVVDGIRNMAEVDYLKEHSNFHLIGVDAPFETRWERLKLRNRDIDLLNIDKFIIDDARDRGFNEPLTGQQVAMCLVHADFLINNEEVYSKLESSELYKRVNEIYREILKKK